MFLFFCFWLMHSSLMFYFNINQLPLYFVYSPWFKGFSFWIDGIGSKYIQFFSGYLKVCPNYENLDVFGQHIKHELLFLLFCLFLFFLQIFDIGVSFTSQILPNFNLKNMVSTYMQRVFHCKNGPNFPDFKLKKFQIAKVLW